MGIPICCPRCHARGVVPDAALHQQATCPVCQTTFQIVRPASEPSAAPDDADIWLEPLAVTPDQAAGPQTLASYRQTETATPAPVTPQALTAAPPAAPHPAPPVEAPARPAPAPHEPLGMAEWFRAERERFQGYVAAELARLEKARRENAAAESQHEKLCINRSIELSRVTANLEARHAAFDRDRAEFERRQALLAEKERELDVRAASLDVREAAAREREARAAALRAEAASLSALVAELGPTVEKLQLRKAEAETARAEIMAKQATLDRRLIEVGRSELALQKRVAELDEMERTLQAELEHREADLERQRATLLEEVRCLRDRVSPAAATPPPRRVADLASAFSKPVGEAAGPQESDEVYQAVSHSD